MSASHELLAGMLALQNALIDRAALVRAFDAWASDKRQSLTDYLIDHQAIDRDEAQLLNQLVKRFLSRHQGDAEQSLPALRPLDELPIELGRVADAELKATLVTILAAHGNPEITHVAEGVQNSTVSHSSATSDAGRFRIVRPHAEGGLGRVYVARDLELNREVALKQTKDDHADNPDSRSRFQVEAEITGRLEHPGIVPVYGLGTHANGRPFYACGSSEEKVSKKKSSNSIPSKATTPQPRNDPFPHRQSLPLRSMRVSERFASASCCSEFILCRNAGGLRPCWQKSSVTAP